VRAAQRQGHYRAKAPAERVKLGIARTFQINQLFRGLSAYLMERLLIVAYADAERGRAMIRAWLKPQTGGMQ
jgi:ABC-type branched-subunit amino acid transport system ATPase component